MRIDVGPAGRTAPLIEDGSRRNWILIHNRDPLDRTSLPSAAGGSAGRATAVAAGNSAGRDMMLSVVAGYHRPAAADPLIASGRQAA